MSRKRSTEPHRYADAPYEVGKGKPPRHSRFKPGQSGNPKGRPKKPDAQELMRDGMRQLIEELVMVNGPSGSRQVPAGVAMAMKVRQTVLTSGSPTQFAKFLAIIESFGGLTSEEKQRIGGVLIVPPRSKTAEEWEREYGWDAGQKWAYLDDPLTRTAVSDVAGAVPAGPKPPIDADQPPRARITLPGPPPVVASMLRARPKEEAPASTRVKFPGPPPIPPRFLKDDKPKQEATPREPIKLPGPPPVIR